MADTVKIPVEMIGMAKAFAEMQEFFKSLNMLSKMESKQVMQLITKTAKPAFEGALREILRNAGITTGQYRAAPTFKVPLGEERYTLPTGEEVVRERAVTVTVPTTVDFEKDLREREKSQEQANKEREAFKRSADKIEKEALAKRSKFVKQLNKDQLQRYEDFEKQQAAEEAADAANVAKIIRGRRKSKVLYAAQDTAAENRRRREEEKRIFEEQLQVEIKAEKDKIQADKDAARKKRELAANRRKEELDKKREELSIRSEVRRATLEATKQIEGLTEDRTLSKRQQRRFDVFSKNWIAREKADIQLINNIDKVYENYINNIHERIRRGQRITPKQVAMVMEATLPVGANRPLEEAFKQQLQSVVNDRRSRRQQQLNLTQQELIQELEVNAAAKRYYEVRERAIRIRKSRELRQSHEVMGLASAGIGLFGQAGFPLLNIAFASMSGMKYAGIAAVATTIGELVRVMNTLQDAAFQSAESIGFLTREFKTNRAQYEAAKAVYGGLIGIAQEEAYKRRAAALADSPNLMRMNMYWANFKANFVNALHGVPTYGGLWGGSLRQTREQLQDILPNFDKMLEESRGKLIGQWSPSWQGPEEMWKRIQAAAMGPEDEALRLAKDQLDELKIIRKNVEAAEGRRKETVRELTEGLPRGMSNIFRGYTYGK